MAAKKSKVQTHTNNITLLMLVSKIGEIRTETIEHRTVRGKTLLPTDEEVVSALNEMRYDMNDMDVVECYRFELPPLQLPDIKIHDVDIAGIDRWNSTLVPVRRTSEEAQDARALAKKNLLFGEKASKKPSKKSR